MAMKAVVDSNVWLSAALSPNGKPAQIVQYVLTEGLAVFSEATFHELETRLWRPKFDRYISLEARRNILRDIKGAALWVTISPAIAKQSYCRDPNDDVFIHTALAANAPYLITGDLDLLAVPPMASLQILTPAQAVGFFPARPIK
jgi:putative PIN family toxin of toxin-antitoxin system